MHCFKCSLILISIHVITHRCTLLSVLENFEVDLPHPLKVRIGKYIAFPSRPGSAEPWDKPVTILQNVPRSKATRANSRSNSTIRLCDTVSLKILRELNADLKSELHPILPYMDALVHFKFHPSDLFDTYKNYVSDTHANSRDISCLSDILSETKQLLMSVLNGTATYAEVTANGKLILESFNMEDELEGALVFVDVKMDNIKDSLAALKSLLKLFQFPDTLKVIRTVCEELSLTNCLQDAKFVQLVSIADQLASEEQRAILTPETAKPLCKEIEECLGDTNRILRLFSKVLENVDFFLFLREHHFLDENGEQYFREQIQLTTAQLQHEEYDETVLNHLLAAYNYIAVFSDSKQSFSMLLESIAKLELDSNKELTQLDTIKNNMHMVQFWFSIAGVSNNKC